MSLLYILGSFLMVNVQNENIFLRGKNFKYFLGCLIFPTFSGNKTVDAGPNPTYEEKVREPPPPP